MTKRVAAIDCGTNSIRLLIADLQRGAPEGNPPGSVPPGGAGDRPFGQVQRGTAGNRPPGLAASGQAESKPDQSERVRGAARPGHPSPLTDVTRQMRIVRLGEGVDRTGRLSATALDRTMTALREYAGLIADAKPEAVRMVATSATRDAANSREFTDRVVEILGVAPEVITGDEEAWLSFTGATSELASTPLAAECPPPYLVTDIGGGSTEFVLGGTGEADAGNQISRGEVPGGRASRGQVPRGQVLGRSVNIGCVRMTERHLHGDPPTAAEIANAVRDIDDALDQAAEAVPAEKAATLVGLAGSVTTVAAIALDLHEYDSARIHHSRISAAQVHDISGRLLAMTRAERAAIPVMHPGRVDVIGAGALILDRIMTRFAFTEALVSEHDILDGIAWSLVF